MQCCCCGVRACQTVLQPMWRRLQARALELRLQAQIQVQQKFDKMRTTVSKNLVPLPNCESLINRKVFTEDATLGARIKSVSYTVEMNRLSISLGEVCSLRLPMSCGHGMCLRALLAKLFLFLQGHLLVRWQGI